MFWHPARISDFWRCRKIVVCYCMPYWMLWPIPFPGIQFRFLTSDVVRCQNNTKSGRPSHNNNKYYTSVFLCQRSLLDLENWCQSNPCPTSGGIDRIEIDRCDYQDVRHVTIRWTGVLSQIFTQTGNYDALYGAVDCIYPIKVTPRY